MRFQRKEPQLVKPIIRTGTQDGEAALKMLMMVEGMLQQPSDSGQYLSAATRTRYEPCLCVFVDKNGVTVE